MNPHLTLFGLHVTPTGGHSRDHHAMVGHEHVLEVLLVNMDYSHGPAAGNLRTGQNPLGLLSGDEPGLAQVESLMSRHHGDTMAQVLNRALRMSEDSPFDLIIFLQTHPSLSRLLLVDVAMTVATGLLSVVRRTWISLGIGSSLGHPRGEWMFQG